MLASLTKSILMYIETPMPCVPITHDWWLTPQWHFKQEPSRGWWVDNHMNSLSSSYWKAKMCQRGLITRSVTARQSHIETQLFVSWVYLQIKRENIVLFWFSANKLIFLNLQNLLIFFRILVNNNIFRTAHREPVENSGMSLDGWTTVREAL